MQVGIVVPLRAGHYLHVHGVVSRRATATRPRTICELVATSFVRVMERQRKRGYRHGFVDHVPCLEDRQGQVGSQCTQEVGTVLLSLLES